MALLQIKEFFINGSKSSNDQILPFWPEKGDTNCCNWEGVTCNPIRDRVTDLTLSDVVFFPKYCLNVSLFRPFHELVNLQLSGNHFNCCVQNHGFDELSHLKRLEVLDLSYNEFQDNILRPLGAVTTLRSLNLNNNMLSASNVSLQALTSLKNLKVLDLSYNELNGSIPPAIGALSALVSLSLQENSLGGTLPTEGFCKLKSLEELDLSYNSIGGVLPPCFSNLTSLKLIDLSTNQFKGEISFILPSLTSLEYIRLGSNDFEGKFSLSLLANNSKIKLVEILDNDNIEVETEDSNWIPKFQLEVLALPGCNLNKKSQKVPTFLAYQSMLKLLDLSHNNLRGGIPNWIIRNNSELQILNLRNNNLEGKLLHLNTSILEMDVSDNQISGKLQENMDMTLPQILYLNVSANDIEGIVPSSICNMSQLVYMDLSNNQFNGEIPKEMVSGCLSNLVILKLSANRFHGEIFSSFFNMTGLEVLHLEDNKFTGPISNAIRRSQALKFLDGGSLPSCPFEHIHALFGSNKFTGSIPETLFNSSSLLTLDVGENNLSGEFPNILGAENLRILLLGGNQLSGQLPNKLCKLEKLNLIDVSNNHLSGQIPQCIGKIAFGKLGSLEDNFDNGNAYRWATNTYLMYGKFLVKQYEIVTLDDTFAEKVNIEFVMKTRSNSYKGNILNYMCGLDLSFNNFTGEIPYELGDLDSIRALNLSHNLIKGPIPETFSRLRQLESLDLSYNNLSGKFPTELVNLNFLAFFSVAHNNLSGRIPMKGQFGTFDQGSYEGNPYLCGELLANKCSQIIDPITPPPEFTSEIKWYEIDMFIFWVAFVVAFIIFFLGVRKPLLSPSSSSPPSLRLPHYHLGSPLCACERLVSDSTIDTLHIQNEQKRCAHWLFNSKFPGNFGFKHIDSRNDGGEDKEGE
nr:LRR receptor-like serine/threonine-protein kinase GSO1 isoform X4 [Ipomoea batatas]